MTVLNRTITFIAFIGFIGIQCAALIDDPQHLMESDPNCPICIAANTEVDLPLHLSTSFNPVIIIYLTEQPAGSLHTNLYISITSIRAPPVS